MKKLLAIAALSTIASAATGAAPERGIDSAGLPSAAHTPASPDGQSPPVLSPSRMPSTFDGLATAAGGFRLAKARDANGDYLRLMKGSAHVCDFRGSKTCRQAGSAGQQRYSGWYGSDAELGFTGGTYTLSWDGLVGSKNFRERMPTDRATCYASGSYRACRRYQLTRIRTEPINHEWH